MSFSMNKQELIDIVSTCQQRSYAEEIQILEQKSTKDLAWLMSALDTHPQKGIQGNQESIRLRKQAFGSNEKEVK